MYTSSWSSSSSCSPYIIHREYIRGESAFCVCCWLCLLVAFRIYRLVCTQRERVSLQSANPKQSQQQRQLGHINYSSGWGGGGDAQKGGKSREREGRPVTQLGWTWRSPTHQIILFLSVCVSLYFSFKWKSRLVMLLDCRCARVQPNNSSSSSGGQLFCLACACHMYTFWCPGDHKLPARIYTHKHSNYYYD